MPRAAASTSTRRRANPDPDPNPNPNPNPISNLNPNPNPNPNPNQAGDDYKDAVRDTFVWCADNFDHWQRVPCVDDQVRSK